MRRLFGSLCVLLCVLGLATCAVQPEDGPTKIIRLGRIIRNMAGMDVHDQDTIIMKHRPEIDAFFAVLGEPNPTREQIDAWAHSPAVEMFQPVVDSVFPNLQDLERQLGLMLQRADRDSLGLPKLRFATVSWGKPQPIVRVDTMVLIALNHYLGNKFEGYSHLEEYRRWSKQPAMLMYDLAGALAATQHPFAIKDDATLLNWMLYEGALVVARMQLVPQARLNLALGYTPNQLQILEDNTQTIWREMAVQNVIYDTDHATINRLLAAAPNTPLLGGKAPGRAARYIGYKIVKEYLKKHPSTTLSYLLSPDFYGTNQTLIESGF